MKKVLTILMSIVLLASIVGNIFQFLAKGQTQWVVVDFPDANSRETYFSFHSINKAHDVSMGKGIKVGILDWGFAYSDQEHLYSGGHNFTNNSENFNHTAEHGYWMANVLKEIAPDVEIYALGTFIPNNENQWVDALIEAINWSIDNNIDILTLSHQKISPSNKQRFDEAVNKAVQHGIVTTFIHYDNENNILPDGFFNSTEEDRAPDINIFQYDYNTLFVKMYVEYKENGVESGYIPYLSISSMSPVTAGFVAILKSINNDLTPQQYKDILINSSYSMYYDGVLDFEKAEVGRVADIANAIKYLKENY